METLSRMLTSKTTWVALLAILGALGLYLDGQMGLAELIQTITGSSLAATLRDTLAKASDSPKS